MNTVNPEPVPIEILAFLNPAFIALVIGAMANGHQKTSSSTMPLVLVYPAVALSLHPSTRERLPKTSATSFHAWIEHNQQISIGLAQRIRGIKKYTNDAIIYGTATKLLTVNDDSSLSVGSKLSNVLKRVQSDEVKACVKAADNVGKLFSRVAETHQIYFMLGISP